MDFYEIFVRAPVNGSARNMLVAADDIEKEISDDELKHLIERLLRKRSLLNKALGLTTKAQRRNLAYKLSTKRKSQRQKHNPRGVDEWQRNGQSIQRLSRELECRKVHKP